MTVPHYGKREPGSLTASAPGDTLYFAFGSYNDSGDSEAMTGLAVGDIEVFKNGIATTRATDSGYSLISDTGQIGDRVGLHRFSVQLFNTADDTGHYESGAWYQVAVDSVTIDGRTVRLWVGSFEIGRQRVDVREFNDTGVNDRLGRIGFDVDTGLRAQISDVDTGLHDTIADLDTGLRGILALQDTGAVATAIWAGDTGLRDHITNVDTGLTNRLGIIGFDVDTGLRAQISDVDTGLHDHINDIDTGLRDYIDNTDTGLRARLNTLAEDTGGVNINSIAGDTGAAAHLAQAFAAQATNSDTGLIANAAAVRAQTDKLTFDTGNELQADVRRVNNVTVGGTGANGNEWGPA